MVSVKFFYLLNTKKAINFISSAPKLRVDLRMPSHYPSFYDYTDMEINHNQAPPPTVAPSSNYGAVIIGVAITVFILILLAVVALVWRKFSTYPFYIY